MENQDKPIERCEVCRYSIPAGPPGQILCRRYPPEMVLAAMKATPVVQIKTGQPNVTMETTGVVGHFPVMEVTGWCGEFDPRAHTLN